MLSVTQRGIRTRGGCPREEEQSALRKAHEPTVAFKANSKETTNPLTMRKSFQMQHSGCDGWVSGGRHGPWNASISYPWLWIATIGLA